MLALRKYLELEVVVFIVAGAAVGYFVLHQVDANRQTLVQAIETQPAPLFGTNPATPTPTEPPTPTLRPTPTQVPVLDRDTTPTVAFTPTGATTFQTSSDGTRKVIVTSITNKDGTTTYNVTTDNNSHVIYSQTLPEGSSITIPYNTWSVNNTYFFIQENLGGQTKIMVFNGGGETFGNGQAFLDLTGVFAQDAPNATFAAATGWASDNLIIIQTTQANGNEGTSYWFGVPDESVTPLATQF
jgi:hypothetical protein